MASEGKKGGLIAKFATVGMATMSSRILGLLREALMAAALGAGPVADVFYTCFRFPNLFRRLFAEGAFNIAFIPLFAKELEAGGEDAARKFAQQTLSVLLSWLIVITVLAIAFMPYLVATIVAPGFSDTPEKFELSVTMTRIMFPYLLCMSLVAMFSGILNSMRKYFLAAFVPVLLNVVLVGILLASLWLELPARETGLVLAWGVFASGILQLVFLTIGVRQEGMHFGFTLPRMTTPVKRLLALMGPALLTGGVLQINLLIGTIIATRMDGANALLNYADRLNQLPLGVIGIAVGVVLLPELTRALTSGDTEEAENLQNRSLEFALALTLPAAVGLMILPHDIIRLLYERGAFDVVTTGLVAQALIAFASGLPAYVMIKVFQPAFFARQDMRTPFWYSCIMVITNIAMSLMLFPIYGHVAIAVATSVSSWVNVLLLITTQWQRGDFRPDMLTLRRLFVISLSSAAMGGLLWVLRIPVAQTLEQGNFLVQFVFLGGLIMIGVVVYFTLLIVLGGIERSQIKKLLRR